MFSQIEDIRKEISRNIFDIEHGLDEDKALTSYFGSRTKITKRDAENAVRYFLELVRDDVDNKLSGYLYGEAQVLKDTLERMNKCVDEED